MSMMSNEGCLGNGEEAPLPALRCEAAPDGTKADSVAAAVAIMNMLCNRSEYRVQNPKRGEWSRPVKQKGVEWLYIRNLDETKLGTVRTGSWRRTSVPTRYVVSQLICTTELPPMHH